MKIRSITFFVDPGWPVGADALQPIEKIAARARPAFESAGFEVQTMRLATRPFPHITGSGDPKAAVSLAQFLIAVARTLGIDYVCIGPALPEIPESYDAVQAVVEATQDVFLGGMLTTDGGVSLPAVRQCARVICSLAGVLPNGFANLRFAALANVPPGAPFFPAAYHAGGAPVFALATEAAGLAVEAFRRASSLEQARRDLVAAVEQHAARLEVVAQSLAQVSGVGFAGIDFTLAPFPQPELSVGAALEALGLEALGLSGSLAASAFLTDSLDRARFTRAGFNGLMLPVLEDAVLAQRAAQRSLTLQDLLLYSAVCGTGLDTVPVPGDASPGQLSAVLLDLAALAVRLDKPLTARLMPIPGKQAGDPTDFSFSFFANSRVLGLKGGSPGGLLAGDETFTLSRRPTAKSVV
jgi:uncharacterized protein